MKRFTKLTRAVRTGLLFGVVTATIAGAGLYFSRSANVEAATSCDKVNIIYCGLNGSTVNGYINAFQHDYDSNTSGHAASPTVQHDYHDVQTIFNYVGADKQLVDSMSSNNTVIAQVHRNGDITVGSKVIATNAKVAARFSVPGAVHIPGSNAYLRTTTSSFAHDTEAAIIREDANGRMLYGVVIGCGNAVKGTPTVTPKPNYTINKEVAVKGTNNFAKNISVKSGTHVIYRITVNSTGNTPVSNVTVSDKLPAHAQYVSGSLNRDGNAVNAGKFFGNGVVISSLKNGSSTVFKFEAVIGANDTPQQCTKESLNNVAHMSSNGLPNENSNATVDKGCVAKPVFACSSLSASAVSRTVFNFTAKAAAQNGAVIDGYVFDFGDGNGKAIVTNASQFSVKHAYGQPGDYTAKVKVTFTVPGLNGPQTVTSDACQTKVTVKPLTATAECTDLTLDKDTTNPHLVTATVTFAAKNGATLSGVNFNWGDSTPATDNGTNTTAQHTYAADGDYTVVATLSFQNGEAKLPDSTCQAEVSFTTPPVTPPVTPPTTPPTELVNTGAGSVIGLFAAVSIVSTFAYRMFISRRVSRDS